MPSANQASTTPSGQRRVSALRKLWINVILARCETILAEGRKPTKESHQEIIDALRGGQDAAWASFPLTQSWFTQIR